MLYSESPCSIFPHSLATGQGYVYSPPHIFYRYSVPPPQNPNHRHWWDFILCQDQSLSVSAEKRHYGLTVPPDLHDTQQGRDIGNSSASKFPSTLDLLKYNGVHTDKSLPQYCPILNRPIVPAITAISRICATTHIYLFSGGVQDQHVPRILVTKADKHM